MYDISKFIGSVKDKDYLEIIAEAEKETYRAEQGTSGVRGAVKKRESGALEYAENLKGFLFFMRNGIKPHGVTDEIFNLFKPVCQNLVEKKQFKPQVLELFKTEV